MNLYKQMISVSHAEYVTIYKFRKSVQIPIPAKSAWGEESFVPEPEPAMRRPHHRQRHRPHRPPPEAYEEGQRESDTEPGRRRGGERGGCSDSY